MTIPQFCLLSMCVQRCLCIDQCCFCHDYMYLSVPCPFIVAPGLYIHSISLSRKIRSLSFDQLWQHSLAYHAFPRSAGMTCASLLCNISLLHSPPLRSGCQHAEAPAAKAQQGHSLAAASLMAGCIRAQAQPAEALDNEPTAANSLWRAGHWWATLARIYIRICCSETPMADP